MLAKIIQKFNKHYKQNFKLDDAVMKESKIYLNLYNYNLTEEKLQELLSKTIKFGKYEVKFLYRNV